MGGFMKAPTGRTVLTVAVTLLVLAVVPVAVAGKGGGHHGGGGSTGGTTTGTGGLVLGLVTDANHNGLPNWGDTITFKDSNWTTTEPHVNVTCTQGGVVVYGASTGYYASYPWPWTQNMTLSSQSWTGGSASCTAVVSAYSGTSVTNLGSLSFTA
jgi:hypothetical protein